MANLTTLKISLEPANRERLANLCGPMDDNIKHLQRRLGVEIIYKNEDFTITGPAHAVQAVASILKDLYIETASVKGKVKDITPEDIHLAITQAHILDADTEENANRNLAERQIDNLYNNAVSIKTKRGLVKPRSKNQGEYISNILTHDVTFGIGPAGTGKTYLAVAAAVDALERNEVRRILLTRPAVEAGEKLGFLPGDLSQKVDPYLRPLYDALFEMLGFEKVEKLIERQVIEIAPLAYMRGRTLNDAFNSYRI